MVMETKFLGGGRGGDGIFLVIENSNLLSERVERAREPASKRMMGKLVVGEGE